MLESDVTHIFECLGLATPEQRKRIIAQGEIISFKQPQGKRIETWLSSDTREKECNDAKLE